MELLKTNDLLKIDENWLEPQAGRVLISEPYSKDPVFEKSVVFLAEHNDKGTIGFILNKPIKLDANPLLKFIGAVPSNISLGGPVALNCIISMNTVGPSKVPDCKEIVDGIYFGGSYRHILKLIEEGSASERDFRFFLGYSGWSKNQLQKEIDSKFWIVGNLDKKIVMNSESDIWAEAVRNLGGHYKMWQNLPSNPIYN